MPTLYLASSSSGAGKTALAAALGRYFLAQGRRVGYFKPLSSAGGDDGDVVFLKQLLGLGEPVSALAPFALPPEGTGLAELLPKIRASLAEVAKDKDVVLVEGAPLPFRDAAPLAEALSASTILILRYGDGAQPQAVLEATRPFGSRLIGVVINAVPRGSLPFVAQALRPPLEAVGISLLGLLPEDPLLASCTIDELSLGIGSQLLSGQGGALVGGLRIGPMSADTAWEYFQRSAGAVAIIRGDRPDLQLGALDQQVQGLLITEDKDRVHPNVRYRAEDAALPLLGVAEDTLSALDRLESFFSEVRFHQADKLPQLEALLTEHFDFGALERWWSAAN